MPSYTSTAVGTGGCSGQVRSKTGSFEHTVIMPGAKGDGVTPDELVAGAWAACFDTTLAFAARKPQAAGRDGGDHGARDSEHRPRTGPVRHRADGARGPARRRRSGAARRRDRRGARRLPGFQAAHRRDGERHRSADGSLGCLTLAGVDGRLGGEPEPDELRALDPAVVLCATGSTWDRTGYTPRWPAREGIRGADQANVLDIATATLRASADPAALGEKVLIYDDTGEYMPLGLADLLARAGVVVELVTPLLYVGEAVAPTLQLPDIMPGLVASGVRMSAQTLVDFVEEDVVGLVDGWAQAASRRVDGVATVVLSLLRTPDDALYRQLAPALSDVRLIGDALAPRSPAAVIYEGEEVGRAL